MTQTQELIRNLILVATLVPMLSAFIVIFLGKKIGPTSGWLAFFGMAFSFICSFVALVKWHSESVATIVYKIPWIPVADKGTYLYLGALIDSLTVAMMFMVTLISTLVHLYSIGYMKGDKRFERFFAYLSLFTFSMLGIVISNSIMQLFVFWELVGLTSYLLIGFWFEKRGPQLACKKAFVMNRIGDAGFLVGFGILFYKLGANVLLPAAGGVNPDGSLVPTMYSAILEVLARESTSNHVYTILNPPLWLTIAGIGLFFGAMGKSAQFPLHTWLPDAMEGPTPVSSIVHSATMVAAGVYLTARIYPILTPAAHLFVATIGLITLVMAACMALVMTDIKRVLAYSTLSQLGYMILALGAGQYSFALYHLITHAFFKCCLFQCAGSVIHAAHHEQDMRQYGGLWKKMPITFGCYIVCTLAIAGASLGPLAISGYYSKDGIIAGTFNYGDMLGGWGRLFYIGPTVVAYLTVFYMTRSLALTFLGKPRNEHLYEHAHEAPWQMWVPQVALAAMAVLAIPTIMPFWIGDINASKDVLAQQMEVGAHTVWIQPGTEAQMDHAYHSFVHPALLHGFAWLLMMAIGLGLFATAQGKRIVAGVVAFAPVKVLHTWVLNKFYFDALYDVFIVGLGKFVAVVLAFIDKRIVDRIVELVGLGTRGAGWATGFFDKRVVDGIFDGTAAMAQSGGQILRWTQTGHVRNYVLGMLCAAALVTLIVMTVVLATS